MMNWTTVLIMSLISIEKIHQQETCTQEEQITKELECCEALVVRSVSSSSYEDDRRCLLGDYNIQQGPNDLPITWSGKLVYSRQKRICTTKGFIFYDCIRSRWIFGNLEDDNQDENQIRLNETSQSTLTPDLGTEHIDSVWKRLQEFDKKCPGHPSSFSIMFAQIS